MEVEIPAAQDVVASMRRQAGLVEWVVDKNLDGIDNADSLETPRPAGNCINWVLGHLLSVYEASLPALGQEPVMAEGALARYVRGSRPLSDPQEALPFDDLRAAWSKAVSRFAAGLEDLTSEAMDRPAPFSPGNDPDETVGSLLLTVLFHQTYHAGQLGLLRRLVDKPGAIT
jgi:uncharacterized damage-inducible protein DinB